MIWRTAVMSLARFQRRLISMKSVLGMRRALRLSSSHSVASAAWKPPPFMNMFRHWPLTLGRRASVTTLWITASDFMAETWVWAKRSCSSSSLPTACLPRSSVGGRIWKVTLAS
ncbi:MAG: hypothetical protein IPJ41_13105 [Phycisphaerales bacterium]|nr:hypothetical protein [Phycisphaerales bacterium]